MDDFVKYSARKEARDAPMHAREPVSSLISPQSYAPSYDSAASRVGPHGGDAVSYAELERLRREQELLRQQVREQVCVYCACSAGC